MEKKEKEVNKSTMHVASLELGIISIVFALFWYISIPASIIAIIFGVKSARKTGTKVGKAGMITGIVGLSLTAFMYIGLAGIILLSRL